MIDRAYMSAHVGRQQREREIRMMTKPLTVIRRAYLVDWIGGLFVVAVFVTLMVALPN